MAASERRPRDPLTLAHLPNGQPYTQLAAGFGIGTTTAYRCMTEAVNLLAASPPPSPKPYERRRGSGGVQWVLAQVLDFRDA